MSIPFVRASIVALLLCAACNGSDSTAATSTGSGGATASSSESSSSASSGAGGSTPGTMDCELTITGASADSNLEITEFSAMVGQGNTTQKSGHPIEYGFAVNDFSPSSSVILNIVVSGAALAAGATYTKAQDNSGVFIDLSINNVVTSTGLHDWIASVGATVKVDKIGPGPVSHYQNVTFDLTDVTMEPNPDATMNAAKGTFKISGKCAGNIQDLQ